MRPSGKAAERLASERFDAARTRGGRAGDALGDGARRSRGRASEPPQAAEVLDGPRVYPMDFGTDRVDSDAEKVVRRLTRHGFEAYLVGGCVRDLLIGRSPKDFDVATNARPDDVRRLFRNSRIIGRRFRLVHVLFSGGKVIETATFRRAPRENDERDGQDLLIRTDNVFGDAHEDAERRDFTINGLFYDIEARQVIDWVGGMPDIQRRTVNTIGDPVVRFLEDPVRILRAIKFSARLDLGISPDVYDAMVQCRGALAMAARPRLFEEVLRLLRGGAAHRSIWLAWETGVLDVLLPELSAYLADSDQEGVVFRLLTGVDRENQGRETGLDDIVLWTILLLEPMREACAGARDRIKAGQEFLEPIVDRLNVPRRIADAVRRIVAALPRLEAGRVGRVQRHALYPLARDVLALSRAAHGTEPSAPEGTNGASEAVTEANAFAASHASSTRVLARGSGSEPSKANDRPARRRRRRPRRPRETPRESE